MTNHAILQLFGLNCCRQQRCSDQDVNLGITLEYFEHGPASCIGKQTNRTKKNPQLFYSLPTFISKCIIAYKRLQGDVPVYLNDLLKLNSNIHSRQTRYCNFNLTSPRYNRETEGGRTFTVTTCKAWNSLSLPVRQRDSVDSLKKALWNEFFKQQQNLDHFSI